MVLSSCGMRLTIGVNGTQAQGIWRWEDEAVVEKFVVEPMGELGVWGCGEREALPRLVLVLPSSVCLSLLRRCATR